MSTHTKKSFFEAPLARSFFSLSLLFFLLSFSNTSAANELPFVYQTELFTSSTSIAADKVASYSSFAGPVQAMTFEYFRQFSKDFNLRFNILVYNELKLRSSIFTSIKFQLDYTVTEVYRQFSNYFPVRNA